MSEIVSSEAAMELAIGLAASQNIILDGLYAARILDREATLKKFDAKIEELIATHEKVDAANILRLIRGEIGKPGRA